jgi:hypothetical protein
MIRLLNDEKIENVKKRGGQPFLFPGAQNHASLCGHSVNPMKRFWKRKFHPEKFSCPLNQKYFKRRSGNGTIETSQAGSQMFLMSLEIFY